MQVDYAMLALGADYSAKNLLHIFGGGFDRMEVGQLPGALPPFCLVARFAKQGVTEVETHEFSLEGINPEGEQKTLIASPKEIRFTPPEEADAASTALIILQVFLVAKGPGKFQFLLMVDGTEVKRLPLTLSNTGAATPENT